MFLAHRAVRKIERDGDNRGRKFDGGLLIVRERRCATKRRASRPVTAAQQYDITSEMKAFFATKGGRKCKREGMRYISRDRARA